MFPFTPPSPERSLTKGHKRTPSFSKRTRRTILHVQVALTVLTLLWYSIASGRLPSFRSSGDITTAWGLANEAVTRVVMPAPYRHLGLSTVQAAIRTVDKTYGEWHPHKEAHFVQILTMLTDINPPSRPNEWQVFVRNATYLENFRCSYEFDGETSVRVLGSFRIPWMFDLPGERSGAALLLHCPIPTDMEEKLGIGKAQGKVPAQRKMKVRVYLDLEETEQPFQMLPIELKAYHPPPAVEVGMCIAPIFGEWHAHNLVDWREHHKLLGFGPVHWYSRSNKFLDFFENYPTAVESTDTYRYAPPIHPETYNTSKLGTSGLYGDQVLYALDCMIRSTYLAPSEWLAFFDLDEYFLPDPMPAETSEREQSISRFMENMARDVPSVSLGRTHLQDNSHLGITWTAQTIGEQLAPRAALLDVIRSPHADDWPGNHKHIHRVSGVEATSVHAPTQLYPGYTYVPPIVPSEARIVHLGKTPFEDGPYEKYEYTPQVKEFMTLLAEAKTKNVKAIADAGGLLGDAFWLPGDETGPIV